MNKTIFDWEQIQHNTLLLAEEIRASTLDLEDIELVCISRGGLFVGGLLSYALGIRKVHCVSIASYEEEGSSTQSKIRSVTEFLPSVDRSKTFLFVDDINDTSETFKFIKAQSNQIGLQHTYFATTFHKNRQSNLKPDFYGKQLPPDSWVVFPWDDLSLKVESKQNQERINAKEDLKKFLGPTLARAQQHITFNNRLESIGASATLLKSDTSSVEE